LGGNGTSADSAMHNNIKVKLGTVSMSGITTQIVLCTMLSNNMVNCCKHAWFPGKSSCMMTSLLFDPPQ